MNLLDRGLKTGSQLQQYVKDTALGTRRYNTERIAESFPQVLGPDMSFEPLPSADPFSLNYQVEHTYFVKVIKKRNLQMHRLSTRWRNTMYRITRTGAPFASFDTPIDMAEHEFIASEALYEKGGSSPFPYAYTELPYGDAAIVYEYIPNVGPFTTKEKTLRGFEHIVKSLVRLHDAGYVHVYIPGHIIRTTPDGEPYITEPIGTTRDGHASELLGIGHDLATLLISYSPAVGTIPAINILQEHYSDVELVAAYTATSPIQSITLGTSPWVVTHVRSSIDNVIDQEIIETYIDIMSESETTQYFDSDPDTAETTRELLGTVFKTQSSDGETTAIDTTNQTQNNTPVVDDSGSYNEHSDEMNLDDTKLGRFSETR